MSSLYYYNQTVSTLAFQLTESSKYIWENRSNNKIYENNFLKNIKSSILDIINENKINLMTWHYAQWSFLFKQNYRVHEFKDLLFYVRKLNIVQEKTNQIGKNY